jgi:hypothetical protein
MKNPTIIAAALLLAACTTQFDKGRDGDASTDTPVESTEDGTDAAPDVEPEVEPDAPPPVGHVECTHDRDVYVEYESDLRMPWGCPTVGGCRDTDFWMGFSGGDLIAISAGRNDGVTVTSSGLFAAAVQIEDTGLASTGAQHFEFSLPDGHDPKYDAGALVLNHEGEQVLLYPVRQWSSDVLASQYVNAIAVQAHTDGTVTWHDWQFMEDLAAVDEPDPIGNVRAIRRGDEVFVFYTVEHDTGMGPSPTQVFGGTFMLEEILAEGIYRHGDDFHALQPTRDTIDYPLSPGIAQGRVVLPVIGLVLSGISGEYYTGLWAFEGPIEGPGVPHDIAFDSTRAYAGNAAAGGLGPDGDLAAAALSSDEEFTLTGMDPPYVLDVALSGSPGETVLFGDRVMNVNDTSIREMDHFDLDEPKLFYDDVMGIFHYVTVLFPAGRNATVHVYSFFPDGTPAMEEMVPNTFETGSATLPAFDVVMSPETGRMYVAFFPGDGTSGSADGFYVTEIACDLITE